MLKHNWGGPDTIHTDPVGACACQEPEDLRPKISSRDFKPPRAFLGPEIWLLQIWNDLPQGAKGHLYLAYRTPEGAKKALEKWCQDHNKDEEEVNYDIDLLIVRE